MISIKLTLSKPPVDLMMAYYLCRRCIGSHPTQQASILRFTYSPFTSCPGDQFESKFISALRTQRQATNWLGSFDREHLLFDMGQLTWLGEAGNSAIGVVDLQQILATRTLTPQISKTLGVPDFPGGIMTSGFGAGERRGLHHQMPVDVVCLHEGARQEALAQQFSASRSTSVAIWCSASTSAVSAHLVVETPIYDKSGGRCTLQARVMTTYLCAL